MEGVLHVDERQHRYRQRSAGRSESGTHRLLAVGVAEVAALLGRPVHLRLGARLLALRRSALGLELAVAERLADDLLELAASLAERGRLRVALVVVVADGASLLGVGDPRRDVGLEVGGVVGRAVCVEGVRQLGSEDENRR